MDVTTEDKCLASIKRAEVLSALGAGVLGAGLALLAPDAFGPYVYWLIGIGIAMHGLGMSAKHRLERAQRKQLGWERLLLAGCWVVLAVVAVVAVLRAFGYR